MHRRLSLIIISVVLAFIALMMMKSCADRDGAGSKIPEPVQRDLDSLAITQPAHNARIDTLRLLARQDSLKRVQAERRALAAESSARASRQRADSLAAEAQSAEQWHTAHDARQQEAQEWEQTAIERGAALATEKTSHWQTRLALATETARRTHLERITIPGLERAISDLEKPCRIGFLPCPNRTVTGVLAAGTGVALGFVVGQALP